MMRKTQYKHCEELFGTNVLVLGKRRDSFLLPSQPLKKDPIENVGIEQLLD